MPSTLIPKSKAFGTSCEELAAAYLKASGYKIVETNFRTKSGEIDIVAEKDDFLIFVEVKGRRTTKYGLPQEAVTPWKQASIRKVAQIFIQKRRLEHKNIRFDVVAITFDKNNIPQIEHIPFAF